MKIRAGKPEPVTTMRFLRVPGTIPVKHVTVWSGGGVTTGRDWSREEQGKTGGGDSAQDGVSSSEDDGMYPDVDVR